MSEERSGVESFLISDPADASRGHASNLPFDPEVAPKCFPLPEKQPNEFLAHIPEANQREIV